MSTAANKQVVLSFLEHFSAGQLDAAMTLVADTATWRMAGKPDRFMIAGTKTKT